MPCVKTRHRVSSSGDYYRKKSNSVDHGKESNCYEQYVQRPEQEFEINRRGPGIGGEPIRYREGQGVKNCGVNEIKEGEHSEAPLADNSRIDSAPNSESGDNSSD